MSTYDPDRLQKQLLATQAHRADNPQELRSLFEQLSADNQHAVLTYEGEQDVGAEEWTAAIPDILRDLRERASREAVALPVDRNGRRQFDRYQGLIAALFEAEGRARCLSIEGHPKP